MNTDPGVMNTSPRSHFYTVQPQPPPQHQAQLHSRPSSCVAYTATPVFGFEPRERRNVIPTEVLLPMTVYPPLRLPVDWQRSWVNVAL